MRLKNSIIKSDLNQKIIVSIFCAYLFGLTMFPKLLPILIVILVVFWLFEKRYALKFNFLFENWVYLLLPILYLGYFLGMIYTTNLKYGWGKMETTLALLILPIVIPTFFALNSKKNYEIFKKWYINGVIFSFIFCVVRSTVLFFYELYCRKNNIELDSYPYTNYFFASYLSYFMHYGYYAMYVNVAIVLLMESTREKFTTYSLNKKVLQLLLIVLLSLYVLMLYSKAAIISLLMIYLFYGIYLTVKYKKIFILLYTMIFLFTFIFILFKYVPYTSQRFKGMVDGLNQKSIDPKSTESTQLRIFAWKASKELILESPMFGYGTGDGNEVLMERYKKNNYIGVLSTETNSHNQYFQTMLSIGVIGILILLIFYLKTLIIAFNIKSFHLFIFPIITSFVLLFESYLSTQAGVFFIATLFVLLMMKYYTIINENCSNSTL